MTVYSFFFSFSDETLYYNVLAGVIAGAVSSAICNPTDVLKVFFQRGKLCQSKSYIFCFYFTILWHWVSVRERRGGFLAEEIFFSS